MYKREFKAICAVDGLREVKTLRSKYFRMMKIF